MKCASTAELGLYFESGEIWRRQKELRCMRQKELAWVAQVVERVLGKDEVTGSIPVPGSRGRGCGLYLQPAGKKSGLYLQPDKNLSWQAGRG